MKKLLILLIGISVCLPARGASAPRMVLVFPLENLSSRKDVGWLSEGLAEILAKRLESPSSFVLSREARNTACNQMGFPPGAPLTLASEYVVAQTLGVQEMVMGDFSVTGDKLTTRVRVLDLRRLKLSPWVEGSGDLADLVDQETRLAWRLLSISDPQFITGDEKAFAARFAPLRLDAFENYIRGILSTDDDSRVRFLKHSDKLDPSDHRAAFELGRFYFNRKDYADSASWLEKLNATDGSYSEARFLLGVDYFFLGRESDAQKAFTALSKRIPLDQVMNNLGVIEARQGQYEQAAADFARAWRADPTDSDYAFNLAVGLWYEKKYGRVIELLEKEIKQRRDDADAHSLLAAALGETSNEAARRRELAWLAAQGDASRPDATSDFASLTRIKKTYDGRAFHLLSLAIENAQQSRLAREPAPEQGSALLKQGQELLSQGQMGAAQRELEQAAALLPASSKVHLLLGRVYESEGKHEAAARELEQSLNLQESAEAHLWLARAYLALHRPQAAMDQGRSALRLDPASTEAENLMREIRRDGQGSKNP